MSKAMDLSGMVFERLTVINRNGSDKKGQSMFLCKCSCGNETVVQGYNLKSGDTKSCGCLKKEIVAAGANRKHSAYGTKTYKSWSSMLSRCNNPNHLYFKNYGGRGIKVCESWHNFSNFLADMGERPEGTSIERINSNGNYAHDNCRWSASQEQNRNKRNNVMLTYQGKTLCTAEWSEITGIGRSTIQDRIKRGWDVERILTKPGR